MRTAEEWAKLFSESLCSTNPVTVGTIVQNAMDESMVAAKEKMLNTFRETLVREPYFFQPEIVDDIITRIKMHPVILR